jgi:transposase-like protein
MVNEMNKILSIEQYKSETESFLESSIDKCWDSICEGEIEIIPEAKRETYIHSNGDECVKLAVCKKCGKSWSQASYKQWRQSKIHNAKWVIQDAKKDIRRARDTLNYAIKQAKNEYQKQVEENADRIKEAKSILAEAKGA